MAEIVLALNAGSSTIKYALYRVDDQRADELAARTLQLGAQEPGAVLLQVLREVAQCGAGTPTLVGHRIVHGGSAFTAPVRVDAATLTQLQQLVSLAPLHLPPALALLQLALTGCGEALHVACFDTAFHATLPDVARRYALPAGLYEQGVRRYGFHGLSYQYVLSKLGAPPPERLIIAHLGSGASLAAIRAGSSIDTSMGLTPTGGVPMGTRSGDLDPGVVLHLLREHHSSVTEIEHLLNHEAGLKGLAGSADMAELLTRSLAGDLQARGAIELFGYSLKKQIGAYVAALGGLDCLVFTGGIGEHAPLVRALATDGLQVFGIQLDTAANDRNAPLISAAASPCRVQIVPTNEDLIIARAAYDLLHGK